MLGFVAFGDIVIALAAFVAGVYFADWAKGAWEKIKSAFNWIKARL